MFYVMVGFIFILCFCAGLYNLVVGYSLLEDDGGKGFAKLIVGALFIMFSIILTFTAMANH